MCFFAGWLGGQGVIVDGRLVERGVSTGSFLDFLERNGMEFFSVSFFRFFSTLIFPRFLNFEFIIFNFFFKNVH